MKSVKDKADNKRTETVFT